MKTYFFENGDPSDFYPICLSRPAYMLLVGTSRIYQKWVESLNLSEYGFIARGYLQGIIALETGISAEIGKTGEALLINGRFLPDANIAASVSGLKTGEALVCDDEIVACRIDLSRCDIDPDSFSLSEDLLKSVKANKKVKSGKFNHLWELVKENGSIIDQEFASFVKKSKKQGKISEKAELINREKIFIADSVEIPAFAYIDASTGPVIIDKEALVDPFTHITGPAYIGRRSRLVGGKVREGCSFGPECRIGGEVGETIMIGYCNKYHEGFLGHAYLGEWVNLGALTTNSDLKNNYSDILVELKSGAKETGLNKVGCFIGDHAKTGIGTMLNTGITIGFSCNLYGAGLFADKRVPSFSWGTPGTLVEYRLEKAVEVGKASMSRRDVEFSDAHRFVFEAVKKIDGAK